jgi:hypothetical protein
MENGIFISDLKLAFFVAELYVEKTGSSVKSVGEFRFGMASKSLIKSRLQQFQTAVAVRFFHTQIDPQVKAPSHSRQVSASMTGI